MEVPVEGREEETEGADFDSFFRGQFPGVARAAALVVRDPDTGQDMAQEAFVRLHVRWGRMASSDHARNFVYRVAINLSRSHLRRRLRLIPFGLRGGEEPDPGADPSVLTARWLAVAEALGTLSSRQRACVVLVDYTGLDAASAARILRISPGTVRVHVMRGRRALRKRLSGDRRGNED